MARSIDKKAVLKKTSRRIAPSIHSKHHCGKYTGSPDSDTVAGYVKHFSYDPTRTAEILKKYESV